MLLGGPRKLLSPGPPKLETYLLPRGHSKQPAPTCPAPPWFLALEVGHAKTPFHHRQAETNGYTIRLFATGKVVPNQAMRWPARADDWSSGEARGAGRSSTRLWGATQ